MDLDSIDTLPKSAAWTLAAFVAFSVAACSSAAADANRGGAGGMLSSGGAMSGTGGTSGGTESSEAGASGAAELTPDAFAKCSKGVLEADLEGDAALAGPGVDPATGSLAPGAYLVATTYLGLRPEQAARAATLGRPVVESLFTMKGFVAFSTVQSPSCSAMRTLTVWQSEEDMLAFVTSPAHLTAMSAISELSRGTSNTIAWEGDEKDATWDRAASYLGKETTADR